MRVKSLYRLAFNELRINNSTDCRAFTLAADAHYYRVDVRFGFFDVEYLRYYSNVDGLIAKVTARHLPPRKSRIHMKS